MMRSHSSRRRFNSREWGDVVMRRQVTPGHWPMTAASAIELDEVEKPTHATRRTQPLQNT